MCVCVCVCVCVSVCAFKADFSLGTESPCYSELYAESL